MLAYIVRRLLLIPPKLFVISLLVFALLNLATAPPPAPSGEDQSAKTTDTNQNYVMFKRQFHLDKPVLLNLRFRLTTEDVRSLLVRADDRAETMSARVDVKAELDDTGNDLVPHLIALLRDPDPGVRRAAVGRLPVASTLAPMADREADADTVRATNAQRAADSEQVRDWWWASDADVATQERITAAWEGWWAERHATYEYTFAEKVSTAVFDTRFGWYWNNLLHLDFGVSTLTRAPVLQEIGHRIPTSVTLSLVSLTVAYALALPLGLYSASASGSLGDRIATLFVLVLYSLPGFFLGLILLHTFATGEGHLFPDGGFDSGETESLTALGVVKDVAWHLVLPVTVYASASLAALSRYARAGIIDVIRADYVRTARAKGLPELVVLVKHAARNGMLPILTLLGGLLPSLVGGSVIVETVFNIPGIGLYLFQSTSNSDYNAVMALLLLSASLTLVGVFLSDLSYALVDPRISYE